MQLAQPTGALLQLEVSRPNVGQGDYKKNTIAEMQAIARSRFGWCRSRIYGGAHHKLIWECQRHHKWLARPNDIKNGTWCPKCREPMMEGACREICSLLFLKPFPKSRPEWLRNSDGNQLEFDGYCEELGVAVEYHGKQHFHYIPLYHRGNPKSFARQRANDEHKRHLCELRGVTLIEIPWTVSLVRLEQHIRAAATARGLPVLRRTPIDPNLLPIGNADMRDYYAQLAAEKGGTLLSEKYLGAHHKLHWGCKCGHEWPAKPNAVNNGRWCPACYERRRPEIAAKRRLGIETVQRFAATKRGFCRSTIYINNREPLSWECEFGHLWSASAGSVVNGKTWCPECSAIAHRERCESEKLGMPEMHAEAAKHGGWCLSEVYQDVKTPLTWKCICGNIWESAPANIRAGYWCPKCAFAKTAHNLDEYNQLRHACFKVPKASAA